MNSQELNSAIENGKTKFKNIEFNVLDIIGDHYILELGSLEFENCTFRSLTIAKIKSCCSELNFHKCTFHDKVLITGCDIKNLQFSFIKKLKEIDITNGVFDTITISSHDIAINGTIKIDSLIKHALDCSNLFLEIGNLDLFFNKNKDHELDLKTFFFNSQIDRINFQSYKFGSISNFENLKINDSFFMNCTFEKTTFLSTDFGKTTSFENCNFKSEAKFLKCKNLEKTHLKISKCIFTALAHFNESEFNHLEISHTIFEKKVSFDSINVNSIKLNQVTFAHGAYFDDIKINQLETCDRKTIRTIKQELQKLENRIDFNRFRAYELAAHYKELDWKWKSGFIDKSILFATKISTDFGNSWRKALRFTLSGGFIFYLLLYINENRNASLDCLNVDTWTKLLSGYFRFLIVTDFYNPLVTDPIYLTNPLSWIILFFGKILIAFGIYEMIQSFRKFKA